MPGFNITGAESGNTTFGGKLHKAEFKRAHRWRVTALSNNTVAPGEFLYLKSAARPSLTIDPAEVHHDEEVAYFAGKRSWDQITFTFYDAGPGAAQAPNISNAMYRWVESCTNIGAATVDDPQLYKSELTYELTNGQGEPIERWRLYGAWVTNSNWNELDYSSNEIMLVTMQVRFDRAVKEDF